MINAIIQNKSGETAVLDLTAHYHEIYKDLQAIGYYGSPEQILLRDEEDEEYRVKLYSNSDIGNSMIRLLKENDTLYDAYLLDLAVTNAREEIQPDLEQNLLYEQYLTFSKNKNKGGRTVLESVPPSRRKSQTKSHSQEVNQNGQT